MLVISVHQYLIINRHQHINCRNSLELSLGRNCKGETEGLVVDMNVVEDRDTY